MYLLSLFKFSTSSYTFKYNCKIKVKFILNYPHTHTTIVNMECLYEVNNFTLHFCTSIPTHLLIQ